MPNFWQLTATPILKIQYFLVCWFFGKNLTHFVPPAWKLDNLYNHIEYRCTAYFSLTTNLFVFLTIYTSRTVSFWCHFLLIQLKLVYGPFGQNDMHSSQLLHKGPFKYYVMGQKMSIFDDFQYCKSSKRWVDGPKTVKNMIT